MADLTPMQHRFCTEYVIDLNATRAAMRAGYSEKAATSVGSFLCKKPLIKAEIDRLLVARRVRTEVTADRVVLELARIGFADARTLHRPDGSLKSPAEWDDDTAAQIAGIEVSRTSTRTVASGTSARVQAARGTHVETGQNIEGSNIRADVEVEESTVKVKRYDKVKALGLLAQHTGALNVYPESVTKTGTVIDPARVARMSDTDLDQALTLARQLESLVNA